MELAAQHLAEKALAKSVGIDRFGLWYKQAQYGCIYWREDDFFTHPNNGKHFPQSNKGKYIDSALEALRLAGYDTEAYRSPVGVVQLRRHISTYPDVNKIFQDVGLLYQFAKTTNRDETRFCKTPAFSVAGDINEADKKTADAMSRILAPEFADLCAERVAALAARLQLERATPTTQRFARFEAITGGRSK